MLKRHWKLFFVGLSQCVDILAVLGSAVSVFVSVHVAGLAVDTAPNILTAGIIIFGFSYITVSSIFGYYRGSFRMTYRMRITLAAKAYLATSLVSTVIMSSIPDLYIEPHVIALFGLSFPLSFLGGNFLLHQLNAFMRGKGYGVHPSLIAGFSSDSQYIYNHFGSLPELGYSVRGFITKGVKSDAAALPQFSLQELESVIEEQGIERIFIPSTDLIVNGYSPLKRISRKHRIKLKVLSQQSRDLLRYSKVHDVAGITLTTPPRYKIDGLKSATKRLFDIVASTTLILLLSPILLTTAILVWLEDGSPVIYRQQRGAVKHGKFFTFLKFRTMVRNAEELQDTVMSMNESDGALFKMRHDPRVTKIGQYLRKYSIDELPQLFNVLKGDMSLVGPRPLPPSDFEKIDASGEFWDAVKDRGKVKPGMTGVWQVSGRSDIKFNEMILLDLYYVENNSFMFDLEILFETIPAVVLGRGAY